MKQFPVTVRFPMHWGEMDALGHVNNARYFTWFETARIAYFQRVGIVADAPSEAGPILATTRCDFLRPGTFPADLVVGARVVRIGRTSFEMEYAVATESEPEAPLATGGGVVVMVNYQTGEKVQVPQGVRDAMAELGDPPSD